MTSARVTWLGHATVLVELGGLRLLTDPVLRARVAHLRRHTPVLDPPDALDGVLLSHLHRDHADLPTLRKLAPDVPLFVPPGAARALRSLRGRDVRELAAGDETRIGDVHVHAVPAHHPGRRSPLGPDADAIGFVLTAERRVYFAGDTEPFDAMAELAPGLDCALLPIWGWGPSLGPGHMDPGEAAQALTLLQPRLAIPIHWSTYLPLGMARRHGNLLLDPGRDFARLAAERAPDVRVALLRPGDSIELPPPG